MTNSLNNRTEILQDRFALKATSYLSAGSADLPYDISERLRAARTQAVSKRKLVKLQTAGSVQQNGSSTTLTMGDGGGLSWWARAGFFVPLVTLVFGLLVINSVQNENRAQELAAVDAALLTDELPPAAFADPGFVQFLKTNR